MTSWNPGDQSGQSGQQQPGYGNQQPGYGQQQPGYGQQQPGYGQQQPPSYGQQPPAQPSAPNFDKGTQPAAPPPPPSYGQQSAPAYGQPAYGGGYGAPQQNPYGNSPYGGGGQAGGGQPVNMGNRVVAFIIDYVIFLLPIIIFYATVLVSVFSATSSCGYTYDSNGYPTDYTCSSAGASLGVGGIIGIIVLIAGIALDVWMVYQLGKFGQTPGKKIMGVKVIDVESGQPIGFGRAFLRYIVQGLANVVCYAGLWSAWLDGPPEGRYRGWHDKAVNSVVISVK